MSLFDLQGYRSIVALHSESGEIQIFKHSKGDIIENRTLAGGNTSGAGGLEGKHGVHWLL